MSAATFTALAASEAAFVCGVLWLFARWKLDPLRLELKRLQGSLEGERSALELVASAITSHPDHPGDSLGAIVAIVAKMLEADVCAFLLYDEKAGELVVQPGAYGLEGGPDTLYRVPINNTKSSSARVFVTGEPFTSGDAANDPHVIARWDCSSVIVVPLTLENRRVGVMRVGKRVKHFFNEDHRKLVSLIAEEAVVLFESALYNRKLAEANQKLSQVNRMKDDLVSTVSHEFKTPLTSIKGFLNLLVAGEAGPLTDEQRRFLSIIQSSADRLHSMVLDLLDLSRLEGGGVRMEMRPIELEALVKQCVQEHEMPARDRRLTLETHLSASLPQLSGDARWLRHAIDNLIANAIKFTPEGGRVTVSASQQDGRVRLTVEDTGIGIGPDDRERVFDRFYRASNRDAATTPGTGLGLAIVKFIVDKHGGKISLDSELGKGSRFHCDFPLMNGHAKGPVSSEREARV